ncbi:hypothetical protein ACN261_08100 [Micromonospora sp. WMMD723]|uniref:hypothetical protein n=1 Tax=unclassified Micromonospora TaxID=2617518 RepID=UPI003B92A182
MSNVDALAARVRALKERVDEADGYARACRAALARLRGPLGTLSTVSVDVGGLRSRSAKVDRARSQAESAREVVGTARSRLADAAGDLGRIAGRYERQADMARADLRAARKQLAAAMASGVG